MSEMDYCTCKEIKGVHSVQTDRGYWDTCNGCNKPLEEGFHYDDEPDLY